MKTVVGPLIFLGVVLFTAAAASGARDASPVPIATPMPQPTWTYTVDGSFMPTLIAACRELASTHKGRSCSDDFVRNSYIRIDDAPRFVDVIFEHKPTGEMDMDDYIIVQLKKPI